jgi:hypothetical protein
VACLDGRSDEWHDVLVPLVGCPPKAQGMSSWKKCGMPVWKVSRTPSKKSARAGIGAREASVNTATGQAKRKSQQILEINVVSPELPGAIGFKRRNCPRSVAHSSIALCAHLNPDKTCDETEKTRTA